MKAIVFLGPTLSLEEARAELDARYLPPVAQGDVVRAARERPAAIGIIDGYFALVPAVWHKEILWAMAQGIHVFGAASMGALRAAELSSLGMEGVGAVYEAFACGELEDDDEVAVAHAAAEEGYRTLSEAMVDIRSTLRAAATAGVIGEATRAALEREAKALFYPERSLLSVLARGIEVGLPGGEIEALRAFLPGGRVARKRLDAIAMLRAMRDRLAAGVEPKRVRYRFQHTEAWEQARRDAVRLPPEAPGEGPAPRTALVEELQIAGRHGAARREALTRALAIEVAHAHNPPIAVPALQGAAEALCRERGIGTMEELARWAEEHEVPDLERFLRDEARRRWSEAMFAPEAEDALADHLRVAGEHAALAARARDKQRLLAARGAESPTLVDAGLTEAALFRWYFEERLGRPVPADTVAYAAAEGFADTDALRRAVLREIMYLRWSGERPE